MHTAHDIYCLYERKLLHEMLISFYKVQCLTALATKSKLTIHNNKG